MILLICGIISLTLFVTSAVVAILLRKDLRKSVRALSVGVFLTIFVALAPCHIDENGYSFGVNLFDTICVMITQSSLTTSLEAVSLYSFPLVEAYRIYLICLYVLGPLSVASATLSFVKGFGRIVYALKSLFADSYIFSSSNERSLAVCKTIRKQHPKAVILFALEDEPSDADENVTSQIDELGGIIVRQSVKNIKHTLRHRRHYFLLDKDASKNIELGQALNSQYKDNKLALHNVELLIYSVGEMSQIIFYNTPHYVSIHLFREAEICANDLIFNYPLYGGVVDGKLNILLVGGGKIGYEILKKVIWSGYLGEKVQTQINVVDLNAKAIESRLKKECHALFTECKLDLHFYSANVSDDSFSKILDEISRPTYIVVALGSEKVNAETCIYLRRHYGVTNGYPKLHMIIESEGFADKLQLLEVCDWSAKEDRSFGKIEKSVESFEIKGFGSYESAYRQIYPTESDFGLLALACHEVKLEVSVKSDEKYRKPNETVAQFINSLAFSYNQIFFYKNNADQLALSIGYLLYVLDYPTKCAEYLEQVRKELYLSSIYDIPFALHIDPSYKFVSELQANIDELVSVTTERYNRFMYTMGWTNLPIDEIKNKATRDQLRLKYARIGNYDVDALEKLINEGAQRKKNYRQNDIDEILKLPKIMEIYDEIKRGV